MTEEWFSDPETTRRMMASDPQRPIYHFLPPRNWMNDPNGLVYWQGRYHLFYQYNPCCPLWGFIHWGHASSPDLVHWKDHPIALTPETDTGDANGCWSGCVVDDQGIPAALYTGFVSPEDTPVMLAHAQDPDLLAWEKSPGNPVIRTAPAGVTRTDFRDPYVWREGEEWKMVVGAGMADGQSAVLLYRSADLIEWQYLGLLFTGLTADRVQMWECPNFFPLEDQYVLVVSLFPDILGVYYYVGDYDGLSFRPMQEGYLSQSPFFYAPQVRRLKDDRTILMGWLLEGREDAALVQAGWAGVQSLPHELGLDDHRRLVSRPIDEIHALRGEGQYIPQMILENGERHRLPAAGRHLEIELTLEAGSGSLAVDLLASPDGREKTTLRLLPIEGRLELDLGTSSLSPDLQSQTLAAVFPPDPSRGLTLQVFIDGSVVEAWVNERTTLTGRAYPTADDASGLYLTSMSGQAKVRDVRTWKMDAIWPTPEAG